MTACFVVVAAVAMLAFSPARANAAFTITSWGLTPSTTQAAGHPNVNFHLDPDAAAGDQTGDDLKSVKIEFSAGMLANPASISSPCTSTQFSQDKCPQATQLGTLSVQYRKNGQYFTMPGTMYELTPDANSVMTVGMIVRPSGYQKIFLKSSKVGGVATVRTGIDADYGIDVNFDNIPRTLTTTWGSVTNVTIADITVNMTARSGSNANGPYMTFNPTRCGTAATRATMGSYLGVTKQLTSSYTLTGCSSVPFTPTFAATPSSTVAGSATGISATVTVPTADATIQQSHVQNITTTLPTGTTLNFPAINAVGALCTDAQLTADTCPAASQIGTSSVNVPFLPPTMTGKIYLMGRSSSITFGYTLHGSGNTLAVLKGSATAVDLDSNGTADAVRAYLINLPQAPFSSATLNFTAQLVNNADGSTPGACDPNGQTISATILGYSGASVTRSSSYSLTGCSSAPDTTITSSPTSPTNNPTPTFTFTASPSSGTTFECSLDGSAFAACTSPYTTSALADGSHTFQVRGVNGANVDPTPASATFTVDTVVPTVNIITPAAGATLNSTSASVAFTATDSSALSSVTCALDGGAASACTSPKVYTGLAQGAHNVVVSATDAAGNSASASRSFSVDTVAPTLSITSPTNGQTIGSSSVTLTFTAGADAATVTCKIDAAAAAACTSPTTYSGLADGSHTITVVATDAAGNANTQSVTFSTVTSLPTVTITSPAAGAFLNSTTASVVFSTTGSPTSVTCSLDGGAAATCTSPASFSGLSQGAHSVTVTATNAAGSGSATRSFTVDSVAPTVSISSPANGSSQPSSVNLSFTASDATTSVTGTTCKLDAAAATACTSPTTYSGLAAGSHTITVTATDQAGNNGSASTTFTVVGGSPTVTITSPANNSYLNSTSASVAFTTTNSPTSVTCSLDGGAATACTSPQAYSGLAQGAHNVTVTATNVAGSGSATVNFTVDTVAPAVSISAPANGSTTGATTPVTFTATDANSPLTTTCKLDAGAAGACPASYTGLAAGSHTLVVSSTDPAGNTGTASSTWTVAAIPVVTITSPANNSFSNSANVSVAFTATNSPTSITCKLDAAAAAACTSPQAYTGLAQGAHSVVVTATNAAGSGSATVNFTVDTIAPVVSITAPANGGSTGATTPVTFTATDANTLTTTCKLDAGAAGACPASYTGLTTGSHTLVVTSTDPAGNSGSDTSTWTVAATPVVTISSPANNSFSNSANVSVAFTATNSPTSVTCKLDAAAAAACTSPQAYTALAQGAHTVVVTATNAAGSGSATVNFTVDTIAPVVTITAPANGSTTGASTPVTFTATDANTLTTTCKLDAGAAGACPASYSGLTAGPHTLVVSSTDPAGNNGSATSNWTVAAIPVVTISSPTAGQILNSTSASVAFTATNSPTSITCKLDAAAAAACTSPQNYTGLAQGSHTVTVAATNAAGTGSASVTFTVDSVNPVVTITSPTNGSTVGSPVALNFTATDATTSVTGTTCAADGGAASACTTGASFSLASGPHTLTVNATDQAGNVGSATVSFTVAAIPGVAITSPATGSFVNSTSVSVVFTTSNSPTSVTCKLDAAAATACTSPQNYTGLSQGSHTVTVSATNAAGTGSASTTFTVDSVAPVVTITAPAGGSNNGPNVSVAFTATDATTSVTGTTCKLDAAAAVACTSPQAYTGLTAGSHTVTVAATDQASNTGSASVTFNVVAIPVVTITSPANGSISNSTSASVAFTATNSPTSTTCKLDAAAATSCTSPQSYTGLSQGSHTVTVSATNAAGTGSASTTFTVDSVAPVVTISSPTAGQITGPNVSVAFTATDATTSVTGTTCKLDAAAATACTSPQSYTGLAAGSHTVTVSATDQATNTGSASVTFSVASIPTVTITSPASGAILNTTTPSVTFTTTGSPTSITCQVDAGAAAACTSPFTPAALSQGSHTVTVAATNASGTGSASVSFTVDTVAPVVTITAPAGGSNNGSNVSVTFTATDATTSVTGTTCKLDAAAATACTSPQNYTGLAAGSHTVVVSATDQATNTGSASVTFNVVAIPVVTISSPTAGQVLNSTSASVAFTATNSPTSTTCKLDAAAATACTSPQSYTGLAQGSHTVTVSATNAAGTGSASVTFTVDTVAPVVTITAPASGANTGPNVSVTFTATDATTSVTGTTCKLDAAAAAACTSPQSYTGLSVGSHTVTVTATDTATNTGSASVTFNVLAIPTVTITSPAAGAFVNTTTPAVNFTTTGSPTSVTCKVDAAAAAACTSPFTPAALSQGSHTITVSATNASGTGTASVTFTVDTIAPAVSISAPANGSTTGASTPVTFTATDANSPLTTTCKLDAGAAGACPASYSGLSAGSHTLVVSSTDPAGNTGSATSTWTVALASPPTVTITTAPGPATASQTPSFSFTTTNSPTSITCSMDGGAASACTSPFTAPTLSDQAVHTFTVTVSNAAGTDSKSSSTWVDTRPYGVSATLTQLPNTITTAANVSAPLAHPNVRSLITLAGAKDTKNATLVLPHGLEGSLASIPDPSSDTASTHRRCSIAQANAGTCPTSSIIGQGSGTIVTTDSSTPLTVTGTGYLTDAPTSADAAGVAIKATVPGGRGDIIATGTVNLVNNGATIQMTATNIPTSTTLGVPFHATSLDVTINGDTGASNTPSRPLITNPSYCFTPTPTTGTFGPFNASTNPSGYIGQFGSVVGNITAYDNTTATTSVPYPVTGCSNTVAPFAPTFTQTLLSPTPGTSTAVIATVNLPTDNSAIIRILSKEPAKLGPNTSAYGNSTDMCPSASANAAGAVGVGNTAFNVSSCPAQARIGQVRIQSNLIDTSGTAGNKLGTGDGQIVGDVYLINKSPLPWLGIHIDPTITYPGRGVNASSQALKNPQGVSADLLATTATPTVHPTCSSGAGDPNCGIGQSSCDTDTQFCQTQISVTVPNIPDLPIQSTSLYLGVLGDGTTPPPGRVGVGGITSNNPINVITSGDNTCSTGIDPNTPGADTGGGTPFSANVTGQFTAWSRTNATGTALSGTTLVNTTQAVSTPGC